MMNRLYLLLIFKILLPSHSYCQIRKINSVPFVQTIDSVINIFYDYESGHVIREFKNDKKEFKYGTPRYFDSEGKRESGRIRLYEKGILTERGERLILLKNEEVVSIFNNAIITSLKDPFEGTTSLKKYSLGSGLKLMDSLVFPSPYIDVYAVKRGRYLVLNEGMEVNGNFIVFDSNFKHIGSFAPFEPNGYNDFDILSEGQNIIIGACHKGESTGIIKTMVFDEKFSLLDEDSFVVKNLDSVKYASDFGKMYLGKSTILYASIIPNEGDNKQVLSAYNKNGALLWKKNYQTPFSHKGLVFKQNVSKTDFLALLYDSDNNEFVFGVFDDLTGEFKYALNYTEYYKKLLGDSNLLDSNIWPVDFSWIDNDQFCLILAQKNGIGSGTKFINNTLLSINFRSGAIKSIKLDNSDISKVIIDRTTNNLEVITTKSMTNYEKL